MDIHNEFIHASDYFGTYSYLSHSGYYWWWTVRPDIKNSVNTGKLN